MVQVLYADPSTLGAVLTASVRKPALALTTKSHVSCAALTALWAGHLGNSGLSRKRRNNYVWLHADYAGVSLKAMSCCTIPESTPQSP